MSYLPNHRRLDGVRILICFDCRFYLTEDYIIATGNNGEVGEGKEKGIRCSRMNAPRRTTADVDQGSRCLANPYEAAG